jgi:hypothetical protein
MAHESPTEDQKYGKIGWEEYLAKTDPQETP